MNENSMEKKKLLRRYRDDIYTRKDAEDLFQSIRSNTILPDLTDEMDQSWQETEEESVTAENYKLYLREAGELLRKIDRKDKKKKELFLFRSAAAVLLLLFTLGTVWFFTGERTPQEYRQAMIELRVENGKHRVLILPDGTQVRLNAGSVIRYPRELKASARELYLNGEGFFEVRKDERQPFIIHTQNADITVLGTSFNVKSYDTDDQFFVCVESGKVQVDMSDMMMQLLPDQQFIWDKTSGGMQKRMEDVELVKSWIRGGLYFNRTPIRSVVMELERMYNCSILFAPGDEFNEYIYGQHENKSLESVLNSIQYSTDILYRKEGADYILYKKE